jgi:predicted house-cleaning noncanonical NTP pyrophosphatase (MazG superfamily)
LTSYGLSHDEILRIKEEKKAKRGGFDRWIILEQW